MPGISTKDYSSLIEMFLQYVPEPSDAQVHALAYALGVDKETLEAQFYALLSNELDEPVLAALDNWASQEHRKALTAKIIVAFAQLQATEDQDVLEDNYDADLTPPDQVLLNDEAPGYVGDSEETQEALLNDGVTDEDTEVQDDTQQSTLVDGIPDVR